MPGSKLAIKNMVRLLVTLCALALAAHPVAAKAPASTPLDVSFVTLYGKAFVKAATWRGQPTLIAFWDQYCAPCISELQQLPKIAAEVQDWRIATVAVGEAAGARRQLQKTPIKIGLILAASGEPGPLLRRFGNTTGALPYTAALNANGRLCATLSGPLTSQSIASFRAACGG
jgi:thiol-disulfide isomerase/thioredoxin